MFKVTDAVMFKGKGIVPLYYSLRENNEIYAKTDEARPVWEWLGIAITNIVEKQIFVKYDKYSLSNKDWHEIGGEQYQFFNKMDLKDTLTSMDEYQKNIKIFTDLVERLTAAEGERLTRVLLSLTLQKWNWKNMPIVTQIVSEYDLEEIYMSGWNSLGKALSRLNFKIEDDLDSFKLMFDILRNHGYGQNLCVPKLKNLVKSGWQYEDVMADLYNASFFMLAVGSEKDQDLLRKEVKNSLGNFKEFLLETLNINGNYPEHKVDMSNPFEFWNDIHEVLYNYMAYKYVYFVTKQERDALKNEMGDEIEELSGLLRRNLTSKKFDPGMIIWLEMTKDLKEILLKINEAYETNYYFNVKDIYKEIVFEDIEGESLLVNKDVLLNLALMTKSSENKPLLNEMVGEDVLFTDDNYKLKEWIEYISKIKKRYKQMSQRINEENESDLREEMIALIENNGLNLQVRMSAMKGFYELYRGLNIKTKMQNGMHFIDKNNMDEICFSYKIESEMNKDLLKKILWKSLTREFGGSQEDIIEAQELIMLEEIKSAKPMEAKKVLKF